MDFSFVIVNALPQLQQAAFVFSWWWLLTWVTTVLIWIAIILVPPFILSCFNNNDRKNKIINFYHKHKINEWRIIKKIVQNSDYMVLAGILIVFIFIYYSLTGGLTLVSGLLAVYALFYSTMSANYSSRKVVINSWAEKAVDHLRQYKDSTLAVQVARMQLVDKPNYFKVRDVLWYRSNKQELAEKKLNVSYENCKLVIKIDEITIEPTEYIVDDKIEWIKIYAKLDIEQYAVELIKKEFEVMAQNVVFAGIEGENGKWTNKAKLQYLWLHGANLRQAQLQGADLDDAQLQDASLWGAQLQGASLFMAQLQGANLRKAHLQGANLIEAELQGANLRRAHLQGADLSDAHLQGAYLWRAHLQGANLRKAHLQGANLSEAELQGANLRRAHLQGANLSQAELQGADLYMARLQDSYIIDKLMIDVILDEKEKYTECLPNFDGVKNIDSAIFIDDEGTNKKVIAKIKQIYTL